METSKNDRSFRIERQTNLKSFKVKNNDDSIKTDDNLNIKRPQEKPTFSIDKEKEKERDREKDNGKPNLTRDIHNNVQRPKLVPMDGLNLLSNQKKMASDNLSGAGSSAANSDSDNESNSSSIHSNDSDSDRDNDRDNKKFNVKNTYAENMYNVKKNNGNRDSDNESVSSFSSRASSRSSRSSRSNRSNRSNGSSRSDRDANKRSTSPDHSIQSDGSDTSSEEEEKSYEELQREKQFLLFKLERLEKRMKVKIPRRYTMQSNYDDIKAEYDKLKHQCDVDKSIKFQRKILMGFSSGVEFLNKKFDPIDAKLDGWSESVWENIEDYDEVFEELHDKYGEKIEIAPEIKLLMMVGGSAFMFHLSNTIFKSNVPGLNDILKQNPDIMRSISEAAVRNMNSQTAGANDPFSNMMREGVNMKHQQYDNEYNRQRTQAAQQMPQQSNMNNMNNMNYRSPSSGKMNGPTGVDDILNDLKRTTGPSASTSSMSNMQRNRGFPNRQGMQQKPRPAGINIDI